MYNQQQQGMMNQPPYSQTSQPQPNVYIQQMPLQQNRGDGQQNFGDMGGTFNPAGGQQYQRQMSSREMQGGPDVYGYGPTPNQPGGYNVGPNRSANMYVGGLSTVSSPPMVMDQQQHYASQQGNPQQQYGSGVTLHRQSTFPPGAGNVRMVSPEMMGNQYYTAPPGVGPPQQQQQQYSISDFQQAQQQQQPSQTQMNRGQSQMNRPYSMQQAGDMGSPAFVGSPQPQQQQQQAQLPISAPNQTVSVMTSRPGVSVSTTPVGVMSVTQMNAAQYGGSQSVAAGQVRLPLQQSLGKGAGVTVTPSTNQAVTSTGSNSSTRTASQQQPMSTLASLVSGPTPIATQQQQQQPSAVRTAVQPTYLQYLQNSELPQTPYGLCKIAREINHEVMNKTSEVFYSLRSYQVPQNLTVNMQALLEKQMKLREMMDYVAQLIRKLREINEHIRKASAELPEPRMSPRDMIPWQDEGLINESGQRAMETMAKAKSTQIYMNALTDHSTLKKALSAKTIEVNEVMEFLRDLTWEAMPKGLDELPEHILSLVGQHLPVEDQLNYRLVSHVFNQNAKFYLKLHLDVKVMEQLTLHKLREIKMGLGPPSGALNSYTASQFDELSEATKSCVTNLTIHMMKTATNSMAELHTTLRRLRLSLPQPVDLTLVIWNQFRPFPISDNRETSGILTEFPQFTLRRLEWYWRPKIQPNDDRQADGRIVLKQLLTGCSKVTLLSYLKWSDLAGLGEFEHRLSHSLASLFMAVPPALPGEWLTRETSPTAFLAAQFPHLTELQMKVMRPIDLRPLVNLDSLKSLKIKFQADLMVTPLMFQTEFFSAPLLSVKNLLISLNRLNTETGLTQAIIQDIQHLFLMVPNVQRIRLKLGFSLDVQCLIDALKRQKFLHLTTLDIVLQKSNDLVSDSFWAQCDVRDGGGEIIPLLLEAANSQAPLLNTLRVQVGLVGYDLDMMIGQIVLESPSSLRFLELDHVVPKFSPAFTQEFGEICRTSINYFIRYVNLTQVEILKLNSHAYDQLSLRQFLHQIARLESIEGTYLVDNLEATINPRYERNGVVEAKLNWQQPAGKFRSIEFHFVVDGDDWADSEDEEDY